MSLVSKIKRKALPFFFVGAIAVGGVSCGKDKSTSSDYGIPEKIEPLQTEQVVSFKNETLTFSKPTKQTELLEQGDIIGCGITDATPRGLICRVTYVSEDKKTIKTEPVTLADVAKDYHIELSETLTPDDIVSTKLRKGVSINKPDGYFDFNLGM